MSAQGLRRSAARPRRRSNGQFAPSRALRAAHLRESVKGRVRTGVAALAGVLDGLNDAMDETDLEESAAEALERVGHLTGRVATVARQEWQDIREALGPSDGSGRNQAEPRSDVHLLLDRHTGDPFDGAALP